LNGKLRRLCGIAILLLSLLFYGCATKPPETAPVVSYVGRHFELPTRPVIILLLDGTNADVFYKMLEAGELPNIKHYIADRGARADYAFTSLTSVTFPSVMSLLTGRTPSHLGMPANDWFDRRGLMHRVHNSKFGRAALSSGVKCKTIYELLEPNWTAAVSDTFIRGTTFHNRHINWLGICYFMKRWKIVDRISVETLHDLLLEANRRGTFPQFTFFHLMGTDCWAHIHGPHSDEFRDMLKHEDKQIGRFMRTLKYLGIIEDVCVIITADHGMESVASDGFVDLTAFINDKLRIPTTHCKFWEGKADEEARKKLATYRCICLTSGDRSAFLYFDRADGARSRATPWAEKPTLDSLRKFINDDGKPVDIIHELTRLRGVGLVCVGEGKQCRIFSRDGEAVITRNDASRTYTYHVISGKDPLRYGMRDRVTLGVREWFERTKRTEFPAAVAQIFDLFDSKRTGDVVLFPEAGFNFKRGFRGAHGGTRRTELRIPLLIAGPGEGQNARVPPRGYPPNPSGLHGTKRPEKATGWN